jgi:hypothetical protein
VAIEGLASTVTLDAIELVTVGDDVAVERRVECRFGDVVPGCHVDLVIVNDDDGPRLVELHVTAVGHGAIDSAGLRALPVGRLVQTALDRQAVYRVKGNTVRLRTEDDSARDHAAYLAARDEARRPGRRRITDGDLARVAEVYRQALALGRPPTRAVQEALRLRSRPQAARWVDQARRYRFLGPAPARRRAGEADR